MSIADNITVLAEPTLEFRYKQGVVTPHDGLTLFGPFSADEPYHPARISYGVVGTESGVSAFRAFADTIARPLHPPTKANPWIWPTFPGFEAAFSCTLGAEPTKVFTIDPERLDADSRDRDPNKRAAAVVERYLAQIERIHEGDERADVIVCIVPEFVYARCRPRSLIPSGEALGVSVSKRRRHQRAAGQQELWETVRPEIYQYSVDFRRQLKARSMQYGIPVQIIQESTLTLDDGVSSHTRRLTWLCDRAWNLSVALYYKAGGKPWRLHSARDGVCYIGLAYRKTDPTSDDRSAACAAQMFLDSGDGIVFMGKYGPWFSPRDRLFHLDRKAARGLLAGTLRTYESLQGQPLREIFLHCKSGISDEEFAGFKEACPNGVKLVGIRVRREPSQLRLMREGAYPVLRGTFCKIGERSAYLWASGFKPRHRSYDGSEIPVPLRIDVQHGEEEIEQVGSDILALTKLNYNACRLGDAEPVTIGFSLAVGEILVSNPAATARSPSFKFYI